jgi:hypothetical protein
MSSSVLCPILPGIEQLDTYCSVVPTCAGQEHAEVLEKIDVDFARRTQEKSSLVRSKDLAARTSSLSHRERLQVIAFLGQLAGIGSGLEVRVRGQLKLFDSSLPEDHPES